MIRLISVDQFIHIKLPDGRTFQMEKWHARQICRELMVHFNIFLALAPDVDKPEKIVDIFQKDDWLKANGKKESAEICRISLLKSENGWFLTYSDPKSEKS